MQHFASNPVVRFAEVHPHVGYLQDILTQQFGVWSRSHCFVDWLFGIRDDQAN
jgi:hypothetical protein